MDAQQRILVVDDNELFRNELAIALNRQPDMQVIGQAADGWEAFDQARQCAPDLILMDVQMPGCDGLQATRRIKREMPQARIIMLATGDDDGDLIAAIQSGAEAYLPKEAEVGELAGILRRVVSGDVPVSRGMAVKIIASLECETTGEQGLTPCEMEVLHLTAQGMSQKDIATRLSISETLIKSHLRDILYKLHQQTHLPPSTVALPEEAEPPPGLD